MALPIEKLEEILATEPFVEGSLPTHVDRENFEAIKEIPDVKFPNTRAWYLLVKSFSNEVRMKWAEPKGKKQKKEKKPKEEKPKEEKPKEEKPKDDDMGEDDLFGDDADLEKAKEELAEKKAKDEAEAKKKKKKEQVAKSYIRFEVKVFDTATDLDKLAERIRDEVAQDGLKWEKEHTLEPFAFGINKLIVSCIIEDEKVNTDDIIEGIQGFDDGELVQSVDILVFNKL